MRILIVAATKNEIEPIKKLQLDNVDILITGIGSTATVFRLVEIINKNTYNLIINAGIAGSFSRKIKIGSIVHVQSEIFGDLGFEDKNSFIPLSKSPFSKEQAVSFKNPNKFNIISDLQNVTGITVNCSSGRLSTIKRRKEDFNADIENMEGAGVFYVCTEKNIPFFEIRSISNYIEERDSANWNIPLAIKNLNSKMEFIVKHFIKNGLSNK